jgi:hypothetical protein
MSRITQELIFPVFKMLISKLRTLNTMHNMQEFVGVKLQTCKNYAAALHTNTLCEYWVIFGRPDLPAITAEIVFK